MKTTVKREKSEYLFPHFIQTSRRIECLECWEEKIAQPNEPFLSNEEKNVFQKQHELCCSLDWQEIPG